MALARILVSLDFRKGLLGKLNIKAPEGTFVHILDYEGVPFQFHRYHAHGHLVAQCQMLFRGKKVGGSEREKMIP